MNANGHDAGVGGYYWKMWEYPKFRQTDIRLIFKCLHQSLRASTDLPAEQYAKKSYFFLAITITCKPPGRIRLGPHVSVEVEVSTLNFFNAFYAGQHASHYAVVLEFQSPRSAIQRARLQSENRISRAIQPVSNAYEEGLEIAIQEIQLPLMRCPTGLEVVSELQGDIAFRGTDWVWFGILRMACRCGGMLPRLCSAESKLGLV